MAISYGAGQTAGFFQLNLPLLDNPLNPSNWLEKGVEWLSKQLQNSANHDLQESIKSLQSVPWPDINAEWFQYLFGNSLGITLSVTVSILVCTLFGALFTRNLKRPIEVFKNGLLVAVYGTLFILGVTVVTGMSDALTQMVVAFGEFLNKGSKDTWASRLMLPIGPDLIDNVFVTIMAKVFAKVVWLEVSLIHYGLYIFSVLSVWAVALRKAGKWGEQLARSVFKLLFACSFTKPIFMFYLVSGGALLKAFPGGTTFTAFVIMLTQVMSFATFYLMLKLGDRFYVQLTQGDRQEVDAEGNVKIDDMPDRDEAQRQALESRGGSLSPVDMTRVEQDYNSAPRVNLSQAVQEDHQAEQHRHEVIKGTVVAASTAAGHPEIGAAASTALDVKRQITQSKANEGGESQ